MDHISDFLDTQTNTFKCRSCGTRIELESIPHVPCFPCQNCEAVDWEIYSINDTIIYPWKDE